MSRLANVYSATRSGVSVARDHEAGERPIPIRVERRGHLAGGFAGPDDDCPSPWNGRKERLQPLTRMRRRDCRVIHASKQLALTPLADAPGVHGG